MQSLYVSIPERTHFSNYSATRWLTGFPRRGSALVSAVGKKGLQQRRQIKPAKWTSMSLDLCVVLWLAPPAMYKGSLNKLWGRGCLTSQTVILSTGL